MSGAIFLDRDGVLCENRSTYVKSWEEFRWLPGAEIVRHLLDEDQLIACVIGPGRDERNIVGKGQGAEPALPRHGGALVQVVGHVGGRGGAPAVADDEDGPAFLPGAEEDRLDLPEVRRGQVPQYGLQASDVLRRVHEAQPPPSAPGS